MLLKKISHVMGQFQVNNIATRYGIYFHLMVIVTCFGLFLQPNATQSETLTDNNYIEYQVQFQETLYTHAQDPKTMQTKMQALQKKYNVMSPEWKSYMQALSQDREKIMQMNQEVKKQLEEKGIGYGRPRR